MQVVSVFVCDIINPYQLLSCFKRTVCLENLGQGQVDGQMIQERYVTNWSWEDSRKALVEGWQAVSKRWIFLI